MQATSSILRVSATSVEIELPQDWHGRLAVGGSVAVSGVCLTATRVAGDAFAADLSPETRSRTTFSSMRAGQLANLELPLAVGQALDGHWVLGHVDAVGRVRSFTREREAWALIVSFPPAGRRYLVDKGSVAVDGISLTPFDVTEDSFRCAVIPQTYAATNLRDRRPGEPVNLEYDVLAKYLERMIRHAPAD